LGYGVDPQNISLQQQMFSFGKNFRDKYFVHISKWRAVKLHLILKEIQDATSVGDFTDEIGP
jgi:hypothetical protein